MAGYNGRGSTVQSNATAVNDQIIEQRKKVNETNGASLSNDDIGLQTVSGMGISRDQSKSMFPSFNGQQIMEDSFEVFLTDVAASEHPDFPEKFLPSKLRSNFTIINAAQLAQENDAVDFPLIGLGPNLKAQDIDQVRLGNVQAVTEPTLPPILNRKGGFGITDPEDKGLTMGSYFKQRYSVNSATPSNTVTKGERDSVADDPYNYNQ